MCGLSGYFSAKKQYNKELEKSIYELSHRGPDNTTIQQINSNLGFAHARLAIVDVHERSNQPMVDDKTGNVIILNGEIYNYKELYSYLPERKFKTKSDTEILLYLLNDLGFEKTLTICNGIFSFAFWNENKKQLYLARDRFGKKPLFFSLLNGELFFASEVKALFQYNIPKFPNEKAIINFLFEITIGNNEYSFFKDIHQVKNGQYHCYQIKDEGVHLLHKKDFWKLPEQNIHINYKSAVEQCKELLIDAVKIRLSEEVKFAVMLSGGLDSSGIASVAAKYNSERKITTVSAIYPGITGDESKYAQTVTNKYKNLDTIWVNDIDFSNFKSYLNKVIEQQEIPLADGSIVAQYILMEKIHEHGIKVVLSGNGGDEVLAGYPGIFLPTQQAQNIKSFKINNFNLRAAYHLLPNGIKNTIYVLKHKKTGLLSNNEYYKLLVPRFDKKLQHHDLLNEYLKHSLFKWTTPNLVWYEDRNAMGNSVENRSPFLDYRLAAFLISMPGNFKIKNGYTKYILRDALKDILPEEITGRKDKQGFHSPLMDWNKYIERDFLNDKEFNDTFHYINFPSISKSGFLNIWRMYTLYLWYKIFFK